MNLRAKIVEERRNGENLYGSKEQVAAYQAIAYSRGKFFEPVVIRCWMGRSAQASTVYASIWVNTKDGRYTSGRGSAGGYGYHKESAAIDAAIASAGIHLFGAVFPSDNPREKKRRHIDGVGETAIRAAIEAITRAAGYRNFTIV